jgi:uncharacterized protein YndB with AHSA1/START domain/DNA-binding MarR family transcriptional regulator
VSLDLQRAFAAIGEPQRFRIIELLAASPRTVGEVAEALGALQPQTTKHLQVLEAAGVIRVHRLGRRRVARLDRDAFAQLAAYLARLAQPSPDDAVLDAYDAAIVRETAEPRRDRTLTWQRSLRATPDAVWHAWTEPAVARTWWAPPHFEVAELALEARAGAPVRIALREPGGGEYESRGRVIDVDPGRRLVFELAPIDEAGEPLFRAVHTLELAPGAATVLTLEIAVTGIRREAASAVAGLEPGWNQLLDALAHVLDEQE